MLVKRSRKKSPVTLKRPYLEKKIHPFVSGIFKNLDKTTLNVLDIILKAENNPNFYCVAYSQTTMANMLGVSRDTISDKLRILVGLNFVKSNYRHLKSSVYVLSNIFYLKNYRKILRKYLPYLALMLSMTNFGTRKTLSSSFSYSSGIYKDYLVRDYAHGGAQPKNLVNPFKNAILELVNTLGVCPDDLIGEDHMKKEVRKRYMQKKFKDLHNAINAITEIDLSVYGKCKLTMFSTEAIQNARWNIRQDIVRKKPILDPFKHFFSLCEAASLKRKEPLAYELVSMLCKKHQFKTDTDPLNSKKINAKKLPSNQNDKYPQFKSPPKETYKTIQELNEELERITNDEQTQNIWKVMPAIKEAWIAAFNRKMNAAKVRENHE